VKFLLTATVLALCASVPTFVRADDQPAPAQTETAAPAAAPGAAPAAAPAPAADTAAPAKVAAAPGTSNLDVPKLFATTCGWCHSQAGRKAGHGPQLMNTTRTDDFIRNRIKNGKQGAMPAFAVMFNDADIDRIIVYIRGLKPVED
jgi:mono/diheme cytochrome c family protein